jgi:hypothetical protein
MSIPTTCSRRVNFYNIQQISYFQNIRQIFLFTKHAAYMFISIADTLISTTYRRNVNFLKLRGYPQHLAPTFRTLNLCSCGLYYKPFTLVFDSDLQKTRLFSTVRYFHPGALYYKTYYGHNLRIFVVS